MVHVVGHRPARPAGTAAMMLYSYNVHNQKRVCSGPEGRGGAASSYEGGFEVSVLRGTGVFLVVVSECCN